MFNMPYFTKMLTFTITLIAFLFIIYILLQNQKTPSSQQIYKRNPVPNVHVPKFMLDLYENRASFKNSRQFHADVVRSLIPKHAREFSSETNENQANHLLIFELPDADNQDEELIGVELRILTLMEAETTLLGLKRQVRVSILDDVTKILHCVQKVHFQHANNTWLTFNLTRAVIGLFNKGITQLKLVVSIHEIVSANPRHKPNLKLSLMPLQHNLEHNYPILLLSYAKKTNTSLTHTKTRVKRNIEEDYEEETNAIWDDTKWRRLKKPRNTCRRKSMYVNFEEIDYDLWIVQPRGYEAYQCQGRCFYPIAEHLTPTRHAIIQALIHGIFPGKAVRSCCVPTALDTISILYIDSKGVLTYRYAYQDMVVIECGCR